MSARSLKTIFALVIGALTGISLLVSAALVVLTDRLHAVTADIVECMEGVRLGKEIQLDLLRHERTTDLGERQRLNDRIDANLSRGRSYADSPKEPSILEGVQALATACFESHGEHARLEAAGHGVEPLVDFNREEAQPARPIRQERVYLRAGSTTEPAQTEPPFGRVAD